MKKEKQHASVVISFLTQGMPNADHEIILSKYFPIFKRMFRKTILFLFLFSCIFIIAQNKTIDSLKLALKNATHDTTRCYILSLLVEKENVDSIWIKYTEKILQICKTNLKKKQSSGNEVLKILNIYAHALNDYGYYLNNMGNPDYLNYYIKAAKIQEKTNDLNGLVTSLNNVGFGYLNQGNLPLGIQYFTKSLTISEKINNPVGLARALNNLGYIYSQLGDQQSSLKYYFKSLEIRKKHKLKDGIATCYINIGSGYEDIKNFDEALKYYNNSIEISKEIKDYELLTAALLNIGGVYNKQHDYNKALSYYQDALRYQDSVSDTQGLITLLNNIGTVYYRLKNYTQAQKYCLESFELSKKSNFTYEMGNAAKILSKIYNEKNDFKSAFNYYKVYIEMRDSLNNIRNQKASIKQQTEYEYQQKKALADAENKAKLKLQEENAKAERNKQNIIIASVSVVLLLVAVFSVFLYNRFKVTQRQKVIIELKEKETHAQKEIIEEKHKEITDSINYAERIQRSFLATKELLHEHLNEYFILFKPKDVVSGDFYWAAKLNNGNFAFVTADSTGHGVPGAIMSLLNITSLEKAIETETTPDKILNATRYTIIERLKKDGSIDGGKDGMDCSFISFNADKSKLQLAAANNPVWIVRGEEVIDIKADKMPVGKHDKQDNSFTLHEIDLQKGDVIYTLTDGFPDQFGGDRGKKFMAKKLRELLHSISQKPLAEQKQILEQTFTDWVGDLEQIDDVTLVGIRV